MKNIKINDDFSIKNNNESPINYKEIKKVNKLEEIKCTKILDGIL